MVEVLVDTFRSVVIEGKSGEPLRINEGDSIKFNTEQGELVAGVITKLSGKGEKVKIQIIPVGAEREEIWNIYTIAEGSLEVTDQA